ncbi:hypothetical protein SK128_008172, partial [Halocaridina rubra]
MKQFHIVFPNGEDNGKRYAGIYLRFSTKSKTDYNDNYDDDDYGDDDFDEDYDDDDGKNYSLPISLLRGMG